MIKKILLSVFILLVIAVLIIAYLLQINPFNLLQKGTVKVDNLNREFYYHVPDGISKNPKLIFVIHGSRATPAIMRIVTGHEFDKLADENKDAIIVYPAGYHRYWNDCKKEGTYDPKLLNLNDVGFFGKMINYFKEKYNIDTTQVFAIGHSNGGQMCYKLAKEKPQWFRGIAVISANLPSENNNDCFESHLPVSLLIMNGTTDPINPYNGGEVNVHDGKKRGTVSSCNETIQYWLNNDSCALTPAITYNFPDVVASDNSTAVEYLYKSSKTGKQVEFIKVINGGHIIPNPGFTFWPKLLGNVNKDIDAPKVIWDFFNVL